MPVGIVDPLEEVEIDEQQDREEARGEHGDRAPG
jgi:hypothetical protein